MSMKQTLPLAVFTAFATLLSACGGDSSSTAPAPEPSGPSTSSQPPAAPPPTPNTPPQAPQSRDRYSFANGCYTLSSEGLFLQNTAGEAGFQLTDNVSEASAFYMKPTALGSYLLVADYQRDPGSAGVIELLGISDPAGEFLDQGGNFIGEVSYLVSGLGDTLNLVLDPIAPLGGLLRELGESLDGLGGNLGDINVQPSLGKVTKASDLAVWNLNPSDDERFTLTSQVTGLLLTANDDGLTLTSPSLESDNNRFTLTPAAQCASYPEAMLSAKVNEQGPAIYLKEVERFRNVQGLDNDDIFGYVDAHSHISAYEFIGGRINYGDPFHKFGVDHALHDCAENHGPEGLTGLIEQVTSTPEPHATRGWPDFPYWPRNNSLQHHQSYYKWIERAHLSGLKILVNHLVHNEILCQINPQKQNDCDTMAAIEMQAEQMHRMQDYIDAQSGGPGEGWFRIVTDPSQARDVIADGKMAVILGVEASKALNCGEFLDVAECNREEIVERLDRLYAMDVRSLFPVHKFDNAFGGHLPDLSDGIGIGAVLYGGNLLETGHTVEFEECPEHDHGDTEEVNKDALTSTPTKTRAKVESDQLSMSAIYEDDTPMSARSTSEILQNEDMNINGSSIASTENTMDTPSDEARDILQALPSKQSPISNNGDADETENEELSDEALLLCLRGSYCDDELCCLLKMNWTSVSECFVCRLYGPACFLACCFHCE